MKGLLIYDKAGKERNEWFIARLIESANRRGCVLKLVIYEDGIDSSLSPLPDFAIVRTIHPELNKMLEELNIPVFNNYATSRIANDKWQTILIAADLGIETMATIRLNEDEDFDTLFYPLVIKTVDGHGGSEVFLVNNVEECKQVMSLLAHKRVIAQKVCDEPGVDMRVYVMGGKVVEATKRTSKGDFRSNFSLGGKAEIATPTEDMLWAIDKLYTSLGFDFAGVDFIRHNGRWVLNEIEDIVGTRMLYSLTDIDVADKYIDYVTKKISQ